jgi:hypothetical protein
MNIPEYGIRITCMMRQKSSEHCQDTKRRVSSSLGFISSLSSIISIGAFFRFPVYSVTSILTWGCAQDDCCSYIRKRVDARTNECAVLPALPYLQRLMIFVALHVNFRISQSASRCLSYSYVIVYAFNDVIEMFRSRLSVFVFRCRRECRWK